jgi:hypothetical protein
VSDDDQPGHDPEIDRRIEAMRARFPDRFTPAQIDQIRERIARSIGLAATLRQTELENGLGPWFDPRSIADG